MLSFVSAAGVYDVEPDTSVELDSTIWWPSDYKISLLDLTPTESDTLTWIYEQLVDIWNDMRAGFEFVDEDIVAGNTLLSQIKSILDLSDSTLTYILQGVGQTNGYLQITNNKLADLIGTVGIGNGTLGRLETALGVGNSTLGLLESALTSFRSDVNRYLLEKGPLWYLGLSGDPVLSQIDYPIGGIVRVGFLGLHENISDLRSSLVGSLTNDSYSGVSIDNENNEIPFSVSGIGPMLHTWLGDIQNDLGLLSYVFASPQDLELKSESADNMTAVGDSLLSGDSSSSVKVSDITDISEASTAIQGFGDTGVTPGQAFAQLGNSNLFRFFSAETAADLDTTTSTYSRDPGTQIVTNYYEESRSEFFKIIAGEGNDG